MRRKLFPVAVFSHQHRRLVRGSIRFHRFVELCCGLVFSLFCWLFCKRLMRFHEFISWFWFNIRSDVRLLSAGRNSCFFFWLNLNCFVLFFKHLTNVLCDRFGLRQSGCLDFNLLCCNYLWLFLRFFWLFLRFSWLFLRFPWLWLFLRFS